MLRKTGVLQSRSAARANHRSPRLTGRPRAIPPIIKYETPLEIRKHAVRNQWSMGIPQRIASGISDKESIVDLLENTSDGNATQIEYARRAPRGSNGATQRNEGESLENGLRDESHVQDERGLPPPWYRSNWPHFTRKLMWEHKQDEDPSKEDAITNPLSSLGLRGQTAVPPKTSTTKVASPNFATFFVQDNVYVLDTMFLRDACPCPLCRDPSSQQKNFETVDIPADIEVATNVPHNGGFMVTWANDIPGFPAEHQTFFTARFIRQQNSLATRMHLSHNYHRRRLWDLEIYENESPRHGRISYESFMKDDVSVEQALETVDRYGLVFLEQVPSVTRAIKRIAERIGPLRNTFYGSSWDVRSVPDAKNVAYTSKFLDLHMDLLYMPNPPGMQILQCMQPCSSGGVSLFSDAFHAYEKLRDVDPKLASAFASFPVTYGYFNDGQWYQQAHPSVDWQSVKLADVIPDPKLGTDFDATHNADSRTYNAINWSPPFQVPFDRDIGGHARVVDQSSRFRNYHAGAKLFKSFAQDEKSLLRHTMQEGECVLFDNRRILHGRTEFQGERWFRGVYIDTEAWRSRLRVLREQSFPNRQPGLTKQALNTDVSRFYRPNPPPESRVPADEGETRTASEANIRDVQTGEGLAKTQDVPQLGEKTRPILERRPIKKQEVNEKRGIQGLTKKQRLQERKAAKKERQRARKSAREEKERVRERKKLIEQQRSREIEMANVTRWNLEERAAYSNPKAWDDLPAETKRQQIEARRQAEKEQRKLLQGEKRARELAEARAKADEQRRAQEQARRDREEAERKTIEKAKRRIVVKAQLRGFVANTQGIGIQDEAVKQRILYRVERKARHDEDEKERRAQRLRNARKGGGTKKTLQGEVDSLLARATKSKDAVVVGWKSEGKRRASEES